MELQQLHQRDEHLFVGFAESRIGGRAENQDSYGYANTERGFLLTICDGMGGGPGGKTASTIAVNEIIDGIDGASKDEEVCNIIIKAIRRANMAIIEAGKENPALQGMGSTATVLLLSEQSAVVAYVGDSRIYQIRGRKKVFRTFDHSLVFDLVKQKVITEEQARLSAQSNVITRALGIEPDVQVDIQELPYERGDRFVLCSDGIHGVVPEKELIKMLAEKKPIGVVTDTIATHIDNLGRINGGNHDNLTLAIVETKKKSILKPAMSRQAKIIITLLSAICLISVATNFVQCSRYDKNLEYMVSIDSLERYKQHDQNNQKTIKSLSDSVKRMQAKLEKIKKVTNN